MADFRFEKLMVWQRAIDLADRVYEFTQSFPSDERFGLTNQMRRAVVSISSNIAEGSGRASDNDYARFVEIAYGSLMEVVSQAHLAARRGYLTQANLTLLLDAADEEARMLSGLRQSLKPQ
jgi:four helix bundle protein